MTIEQWLIDTALLGAYFRLRYFRNTKIAVKWY